MQMSTEPSDLVEAIVRTLDESGRPLLASEIARRVDSSDSGLQTEVNRCLFGPLRSFVEQDDNYRWRLTRTPTFNGGERTNTSVMKEVPEERREGAVDEASLQRVRTVLTSWKRDLIEFGRKNKVLYFGTSR